MLAVYGVHMQWVEMRVSMMVLQMRMHMCVSEFLIYFDIHAGRSNAYIGQAWGCRVTMYANDVLHTRGIRGRLVAFLFAFGRCEGDPTHSCCCCYGPL
jgi:hypothetical protein